MDVLDIIDELGRVKDVLTHQKASEKERLLSAYVAIDSLRGRLADEELRTAVVNGEIKLSNLGPKLKQRLFP